MKSPGPYLSLPVQLFIILLASGVKAWTEGLWNIDWSRDSNFVARHLGMLIGGVFTYWLLVSVVGLVVHFMMRTLAKRDPGQLYLWISADSCL
jgi:hypothetical protein